VSALSVGETICGDIWVSGPLAGSIGAGDHIRGDITVSSSPPSTGTIAAGGEILGDVTIGNFAGNICGSNLSAGNLPANIQISPDCGWSACPEPVQGPNRGNDGAGHCILWTSGPTSTCRSLLPKWDSIEHHGGPVADYLAIPPDATAGEVSLLHRRASNVGVSSGGRWPLPP